MKKTPRPRRARSSSDSIPLFEYSKIINSSLDLPFVLNTMLLTMMGKLLVSRGLVLLRREVGTFEVVCAKGVDETLLGSMMAIDPVPKKTITFSDGKESSAAWEQLFRHHEQTILAPITLQNEVVGFLSLGSKVTGKSFAHSERDLLDSMLNLSGSAIEKAMMVDELKRINRDIDRKYQELNTLFDLSKEFNQVLDTERVVRLLTFSLLGQIGVNRYAVCLNSESGMNIVASRLDDNDALKAIANDMCSIAAPGRVEQLERENRYRDVAKELSKQKIRAIIPMRLQNDTKGVILLGERLRGGEYSQGDLEFLYALGNLAIISIENARLFKEAIEKQRMEDELKIAREIQKGLLPQTIPVIEGFEIAATNISSREVGGDYYDVIPITAKEHVLAIGDVSGKGTPAALLMASVQAALRALAPMNYALSDATGRLNDLTCMNTGQDKFITFFWGLLNAATRIFKFVNAGHNPPFLFRKDGSVERLEDGGLILGVLKTTLPYKESQVEMRPGDVLFCFTDGVSEAMNSDGVDFTEERLEEILKTCHHRSAAEIVRTVHDAVLDFSAGVPQSDDLTMFVLKCV